MSDPGLSGGVDSPMLTAICGGDLDEVNALLRAGADPNERLAKVGWYVWEDAAVRAGLGFWTPLLVV